MPDVVAFVVLGPPVPKGRPRLTGRGHIYTPARTKSAEKAFREAAALLGPREPIAGPVAVELGFVFAVPLSWTKTQRAVALAGGRPHAHKPDLDNLVKLALDAMNGIVFVDDAQIHTLVTSKSWGPHGKTSVRVTPTGGT